MRSKMDASPTSEELLDEWHMRMLETYDGPLGKRVARAEWTRQRLSWIEWVLCERMWAEPTVKRP